MYAGNSYCENVLVHPKVKDNGSEQQTTGQQCGLGVSDQASVLFPESFLHGLRQKESFSPMNKILPREFVDTQKVPKPDDKLLICPNSISCSFLIFPRDRPQKQ